MKKSEKEVSGAIEKVIKAAAGKEGQLILLGVLGGVGVKWLMGKLKKARQYEEDNEE